VGVNVLPQQYIHQMVNHDQMYVDPVTGCHTNDIKSRWNACKMSQKKHCGTVLIISYVDSYRDIDSYVTVLPSLPT